MSFFDLINPFSYMSPVHAEGELIADGAAAPMASDAVEAAVEVVDVIDEPAAEEEEEEEEAEEEEEEDPEDHAPAIKEACGETMACKSLKHHLDECSARVDDGSEESCAEEFLHFMHCVDECAKDKIFAKLR